jgi:hypothetical protein
VAQPRAATRPTPAPLTFEQRAIAAETARLFALAMPEPERAEVERVHKRVLTITGSSPEPGEPYEYVVPSSEVMWPLSVMATLDADGAGSDRGVWLEYQDPNGVRYLVAGAPVAVAPGTSQSFCWQPAAGTPSWPVDDVAVAPLPVQPLDGSYRLAVVIGDAEAGDQLHGVRVRGEFAYSSPDE